MMILQHRWFALPLTSCPIFWVLIVASSLSAQEQGIAFHRLNQGNGLSQGACSSISRDSRGFVWLSTIDGLNRFDGLSVKVYRPDPTREHSMVGNIVTSPCFEDAAGDLWFTTYNAVHRYVRAFDHFEVFQLESPTGELLISDYYGFYFDPTGHFWLRVGIKDQGFLHVFDTKTRRDSIVCAIGGYRSCVIRDKSGRVEKIVSSEFDTELGGFEIIDLQHPGNKQTGFRETGNAHNVHEVFAESDTLLWMGLSNGFASYNLKTGQSKVFSSYLNKPVDDVWSVYPFRDSLLFVASVTRGLLVFNKRSQQFVQQFLHEPENVFSLQGNETRNLFIDDQENLWVAQWSRGVSFANLRKQKFLSISAAKNKRVSRLLQGPDGHIWCNLPGEGIVVFTPDGEVAYTLKNRLPKDNTTFWIHKLLWDHENKPLLLSSSYLFHWDEKKRQLKVAMHVEDQMMDGLNTPDGAIYVALKNGIFQLQGKHYRPVPVQWATPYPFKGIRSVYRDKKRRWYVSENTERLLIFEETPAGLSLKKDITGIGEIKSFFEIPDGSGMWMACSAGLLFVAPDLESHLLNELSHGLPAETYYSVMPDHQGRLWLSSNQGMICYDPGRKTYQRHGQVDGLFGNEFNTGSWYQSPDGRIWAGGQGGLAFFHPDSIRPVPFAPQVQITNILVKDEPYNTEIQVSELSELNFPYSRNTLSFEFVALEFSYPAANRFKYRLLGYDGKWVESGTRGFARYANLPPGQYTFEVLAANSDGVWSTIPKSLRLFIQTPYYKTWWFYLICSLIAAGLIYAWFWYRLQQALRIERIRVQISSDLHDDVGTLLAGLAMQSEALALTAPEKDKGKLQRISEISRNAMAHMRDTVWAIDARKDKLENLLDRMREHAEETLTPRDIRFDIHVDNLSLHQNLSTSIRQNIYLIYKEAIANIAKHTNGDSVNIQLKKSAGGFEMHICDNGQVPEKTFKTTGLGTSNMLMRAEKIGGTLEITRNHGFCVILRLRNLG